MPHEPATFTLDKPILDDSLDTTKPLRLDDIELQLRARPGVAAAGTSKRMRLVLMSDTHGLHDFLELPTLTENDPNVINILLHAGDMSHDGREHEMQSFSTWLQRICTKFDYILVTHGNHETLDELDVSAIQQKWYDGVATASDGRCRCVFLQDQFFEIFGVGFYGAPWTPNAWYVLQKTKPPEVLAKWTNFDDKFYFLSEEALRSKWQQIPAQGTHILITHTPPNGILDKNEVDVYVGSESLAQRLDELSDLRLHLFGHIHTLFGYQNAKKSRKIENLLFVNASIEKHAREGYR